jgi:hypothetical protein
MPGVFEQAGWQDEALSFLIPQSRHSPESRLGTWRSVTDGSCFFLVNVRYRDGIWRFPATFSHSTARNERL